jgi:hypothetical protein
MLGLGDYPNISNCRTKIVAVFRGIFIIFLAVFQNRYVFHYLCWNSVRFHGTRCEKHWFTEWHEPSVNWFEVHAINVAVCEGCSVLRRTSW